eukprot:CAMPEP_0174839480 /NCGR_PEP_ID=MMETSP1114-20130205/8070_1 /TAXON_ID=312471 /ORGANISM="Neobodo designis, Strain CCAP 1951/1" /LENGTH=153 /DNA_ID=CAMNT_0016073601 /DNA_START=138 /DNA_END=596 /DNA_ORIENTATION=-
MCGATNLLFRGGDSSQSHCAGSLISRADPPRERGLVALVAHHADELRREERDALAEVDQLVVVRVDKVEQRVDLVLRLRRVDRLEHQAELVLVDDAVAVRVVLLEDAHEAGEEALVALQLEVEQDAEEVAVGDGLVLLRALAVAAGRRRARAA